jgi:hypothetical protein
MKNDTIETPINFGPNDRRKVVVFRGKAMQPWRARRILDNRAAIETLNSKGYTQKEAAHRLRRSITCFRMWVQALGIKWKNLESRKPWTRIDKTGWKDAILAGMAAGKTQAQIAKELGVTVTTVNRHCPDVGIDWMQLRNQRYLKLATQK